MRFLSSRFVPIVAAALLLMMSLPRTDFADPPVAAEAPANAPQPAEAETPPMLAEPPAESDEEAVLPKLDELPLPSAEELLRGPRHDWIVLRTKRVIIAESVHPRPKTLEAVQARIVASNEWPRPRTKEELDDWRRRREALYYVTVTLPRTAAEEAPVEYRLHIRHITQILHHEDLYLQRVDTILDEGRLRDAYEMLFLLERRVPEWPGIAERQNRLLFLEAGRRFDDGAPEAALTLLEELHDRDPQFRELKAELGRIADMLMAAAYGDGDFRRVRHFLARLRRREADHPTAADWESKLLNAAGEEVKLAEAAADKGDHSVAAEHADRAARIWPQTPGLTEIHHRVKGRFQQLRVGVLALSCEPSPLGIPDAVALRHERLTTTPLFELDSVDNATHYRSPYFENWEPGDLGRRVTFSLRPRRGTADPVPLVTAATIAGTFHHRLDSEHSAFDPRFAAAIGSVSVGSPFEFTIEFERVPLRVEPLLAIPPARSDDMPTGRFQLVEQSTEHAVYRRRVPQPDGLVRYQVAEIREERFDSHDKAMQALLRGEVSMLPSVQPWDVPQLQNDRRFFVQPYALPRTHVLQFHPKTAALHNRELRRALAYALDLPEILRETVLRNSAGERGRLVTAPYSTKSHAYNGLVAPRPSDPALAVSLALAAQKQMGGELPVLRMVCERDPIAAAAAAELIKQWKRAGIAVELIEAESPVESHGWDICYRTLSMVEPARELWPLLALSPVTSTGSLAHLPDWLRREFVALELASDWNTATAVLHRLHEQLYRECHLIPLWETDEFLVLRKNVRGFRTRPVHCYQDVDRWVVEPWFPTEVP